MTSKGRYEGSYLDGKRHGEGVVEYGDGSRFEGVFEHGEMIKGKMSFASGTVFQGEMKNGAPDGNGIIEYASGARYKGAFVAGKKHGQGTFVAADGSHYEGSWTDDAVEGFGKMVYSDGRSYEGEFVGGMRHGKGICTYPNGSTYVGDFVNDVREGQGKMTHEDNSTYSGQWQQNQPHGNGVYTFANGDSYSGTWNNGKREGQGSYQFAEEQPLSSTPATPPRGGLHKNNGNNKIALVSDGSDKVNGAYTAQSKRGKYDELVYYNKYTHTWLYQIDSHGHYAIGRKKGGKACLCFNKNTELTQNDWVTYQDSRWQPAPALSVQFVDHTTPKTTPGGFEEFDPQNDGVAEALAVHSRFSNIDGGYLRDHTRNENGKAVYRNAQDKKELWYGPTGAWMVSDEAGVKNGSYASYVSSAPTECDSPEDADWQEAGLSVKVVPPPSKLQDIERYAQSNAANMFKDPDFPEIDASIGPNTISKSKTGVKWIRPTVLQPPGEPILLFNGIEPNDIMQGALGDCWLLSAIAALTEFPSFIEDRLFITQELSRTGKYELRAYNAQKSQFETVIIDDAIPCSAGAWWEPPKPLFAQPNDNELYILMLEKMFAKLAGSYDALSGGYPLLAWGCMTGCEDLQSWKRLAAGIHAGKWHKAQVAMEKIREQPFNFQKMFTISSSIFNDAQAMFSFLQQCDDLNYIMAASISGSTIEKRRTDGLVERHAYSLIQVKNISANIKLVQLRNPWGNGIEWNGSWSDHADEWKQFPDVARQLNYQPRDDGLFWMSWDDFSSTFDGVQIAAIEMPTRRASHPRA